MAETQASFTTQGTQGWSTDVVLSLLCGTEKMMRIASCGSFKNGTQNNIQVLGVTNEGEKLQCAIHVLGTNASSLTKTKSEDKQAQFLKT